MINVNKENKKGMIIVLEALDSSGKGTQTRELFKRLTDAGYPVHTFDYPRYTKPSSQLVKSYLSGEFGENAQEVDPYLSSSFYAIDRFVSFKTEFKELYESGAIILLDRYTTSNMVHQGGKIKDLEEKDAYLDWLNHLEFEVYGIPKPDVVFYLSVEPEVAIELMKNRKNKFTGEDKKDIHERDKNHLDDAFANADYLINKYNWSKIKCTEDGQMRSIQSISDEIFTKVVELINK